MIKGARSVQLPVSAGIGLRAPHYSDFVDGKADIGFLEIHPENYFGGGLRRAYLQEIAQHYPISFHCVGMSLGSVHRPNAEHLKHIKQLADQINPRSISDHVSWSASGNAHLNDLLPLPYTHESMATLISNITYVQDVLGRQILIENPSVYACFKNNPFEEVDFINEIASRTGCGILLDINNIFVNACNNHMDAKHYLDTVTSSAVHEIHLAGHTINADASKQLRIDTHDHPVCDDVWSLYTYAIQRLGAKPTLIEWDAKIPALSVLLEEAKKAQTILNTHPSQVRHAAA